MSSIERILVPSDFSPCANAALEYAIFLAERFDAGLHLLHVWEPLHVTTPDLLWRGDGPTALAEVARTHAGKEMERALGRLERRGMRARGRLETGDPYRSIIRLAGDEKFDLIVMGTHGHTGLRHLISGSVAERVVRHAPCPVMTVRLPDAAAQQTMDGVLP
jgi:universal stress protein A